MIIHAGVKDSKQYLLLKKLSENHFQWFEWEKATEVQSDCLPKALSSAHKVWKPENFRLLHCGFRYLLPERDQVGSNALFWQMALSYNSPNGRYFDEEAGHLCYVDFASQEALALWKQLRSLKLLETTNV